MLLFVLLWAYQIDLLHEIACNSLQLIAFPTTPQPPDLSFGFLLGSLMAWKVKTSVIHVHPFLSSGQMLSNFFNRFIGHSRTYADILQRR
jgi:hypothetical protein